MNKIVTIFYEGGGLGLYQYTTPAFAWRKWERPRKALSQDSCPDLNRVPLECHRYAKTPRQIGSYRFFVTPTLYEAKPDLHGSAATRFVIHTQKDW